MVTKSKLGRGREGWSKRFGQVLGWALLCGFASSAMAVNIGRDIIGPHEYDLPLHFDEPLNFFVQYTEIDSSDQIYNDRGDEINGDDIDSVVGLSKYVRAWVPTWAPDIALAYEVIVPEVGVRNTTANTSTAGFADPITGPVIWFKPWSNVTIGQDFLIQVPVGDSDVGGGNVWNLNTALLYNVNFGNFSFGGDVGVIQPLSESTAQGSTPGTTFFTDNTLSYKVLSWLEPFVGVTYESTGSSFDRVNNVEIPNGHETVLMGGVYLPFRDNQSLTLSYQPGVEGKNHEVTREFEIKYVYAWQ